jgi:glutaredoxin-related protein
MKYYNLYIKVNCELSKKAIQLLENEQLPFVLQVLDKCPEFESATKATFNWGSIPIIIEIDGDKGTFIGGLSELEKYIKHIKKHSIISGDNDDGGTQ